MEKTYKSGDSLEAADVIDLEMQYLYNDGDNWYFMEQNNFEQFSASEDIVADAKQWITGEEMCFVTLWNDAPLTVTPPNFVFLKLKILTLEFEAILRKEALSQQHLKQV